MFQRWRATSPRPPPPLVILQIALNAASGHENRILYAKTYLLSVPYNVVYDLLTCSFFGGLGRLEAPPDLEVGVMSSTISHLKTRGST